MKSARPGFKVLRVNSPWFLLMLLPLMLVFFALTACVLFVSLLMKSRPKRLKNPLRDPTLGDAPLQKSTPGQKPKSTDVIEAEYYIVNK